MTRALTTTLCGLAVMASTVRGQEEVRPAPAEGAQPAVRAAGGTRPAETGLGGARRRRGVAAAAEGARPEAAGAAEGGRRRRGVARVAGGARPGARPATRARRRPSKLPTDLAEMLAVAIESNPEIEQAEAKLRQAQADLKQVRLSVTRQVVTSFHQLAKERELQKERERELESWKRRVEVGNAREVDGVAVRVKLTELKARSAQIEATLRYLMGRGGEEALRRPRSTASTSRRRRRPMGNPFQASSAPAIQEATGRLLDASIEIVFTEEMTLEEAVPMLQKLSGLSIWADPNVDLEGMELQPLRFNGTVRSLMLALSDNHDVCFVFRDYGVLLTSPRRGATMSSPSLPTTDELRRRFSDAGSDG